MGGYGGLRLPDVFLSYSHEDAEITRTFAEALEAEGLDVWWDITLRSGEAYDERIETALREAKAVVVLWSRRSVQSRWVRAEATLADRNRTLAPVMIEACERPIMFELTHTNDLSHWRGDRTDKAWLTFLRDLGQFTGGRGPSPQVRDAVPAAPVKRGGRASLAILPFTNRSGERADDIFATGMVEDVIAALSLSHGVKVIAQSAAAVYRKNVSDLRSIGRELGARYILEGNVRRISEDLRVTAQLVEAENGAILWTQRFDSPLAQLASLQEDLVTELASQLGVQVRAAEMAQALRKPGDLTAWEAVMRAWAAYGRFSPDSIDISIAESRRAVALAPDYAVAHSSLAQALGNSYQSGHGLGDPALAKEAYATAHRALKLNSGSATVLFQCAQAIGLAGRKGEGLRLAERAVELNPNLSDARSNLGMFYTHANRNEEALTQFRAELALAPRGRHTFICLTYSANVHYQAGEYQQAVEAVDRALSVFMGSGFAWRTKAFVCEAAGMREEACEAMREARLIEPQLTPDLWAERVRLGWMAPVHQETAIARFDTVWRATPLEAVGA